MSPSFNPLKMLADSNNPAPDAPEPAPAQDDAEVSFKDSDLAASLAERTERNVVARRSAGAGRRDGEERAGERRQGAIAVAAAAPADADQPRGVLTLRRAEPRLMPRRASQLQFAVFSHRSADGAGKCHAGPAIHGASIRSPRIPIGFGPAGGGAARREPRRYPRRRRGREGGHPRRQGDVPRRAIRRPAVEGRRIKLSFAETEKSDRPDLARLCIYDADNLKAAVALADDGRYPHAGKCADGREKGQSRPARTIPTRATRIRRHAAL